MENSCYKKTETPTPQITEESLEVFKPEPFLIRIISSIRDWIHFISREGEKTNYNQNDRNTRNRS